MATLVIDNSAPTLGYNIQYYDGKKRKTIYLGGRRFSRKTAEKVKEIVEILIYYRDNGITVPDKSVLYWLETVSDAIRNKLAKAGLIEIPDVHTCQELWQEFMTFKETSKIKPATFLQYTYAQKRFFEYFDEKNNIDQLKPEHFLDLKEMLLKRYETATVAGTIKQFKAVLNFAKNVKKWIEVSPLAGIGCGSFRNKSKDRIVSAADYEKMLAACPNQEWRTIIALARYGGLRCPSEVALLRWSDVHWSKNRFFVRSPKTEHHDEGESRIVPLFPELRKELDTLFFSYENNEENKLNHAEMMMSQEFVIPSFQVKNTNLGKQIAHIVKLAGLPTLPRPFDNMRMTRSNEVYNKWGAFKESQWIGHTAKTRSDHYLMITDDDYDVAAK
jgi:integrase